MTQLEYTTMLCTAAANGLEPGKVFNDVTKGENGVKGLKRDQFNEFYARLVTSSFFRSAELGAAIAKDVISRAQRLALDVKCTPEEALRLSPSFSKLEQGGRPFMAAFEDFKPFLGQEDYEVVRTAAKDLWFRGMEPA